MTVNQATRLVRSLVGEDDFHDVKEILPSYYNLAQKQIATTVAPIKKTVTLRCGVCEPLPDDFYRLVGIDVSFTRPDRNHIVLDGEGTKQISYFAYPSELYDDTDGSTEFEIDEQAQSAIPYYAAAQTVLSDSDLRRYYAFMDMYNNILSNISDSHARASVLTVVKTEDMR